MSENKPVPQKLPPVTETGNNDLALILDKAATFLSSAVDKQNEKEVHIAEINKPIYEANIELEKDKIGKQHEAWTKVTDASIAKDKREFRLGAAIALIILVFLVTVAAGLIVKGEYQAAFPIITLIAGLIGGFGGAHWQKQQKGATGNPNSAT